MKKVILLVLIIFITGCTSEYNLTIENNSFKENINISINKNLIPEPSSIPGVETDDSITPFLEQPTPAFFSKYDKNYEKKVEDKGNYYDVNLKYNYTFDEFKGASSLRTCFEDIEISGEDIYYIRLKGMFYCLYSDSVDIKIKTNNDVINHNADRKEGNTYIWSIHNGNVDNVDILFEVTKDIKNKNTILEIGIIIICIIVIGIILNTVKKKNEENNKFE